MLADVSGQDANVVGVRVVDDQGDEHRVVLGTDGSVEEHAVPERLPAAAADRSDAEERLVTAVQRRARYAAHCQTDHDLVESAWDPRRIRAVTDAVESLSPAAFEELFADTYRLLQDPPVSVPLADVDVIVQGIYLDHEGSVEGVSEMAVAAERGGRYEWVQGAEGGPEATALVALPPMEFDFPLGERFQAYLGHHLRCQIRDIYLAMGEDPPEDCQLEGIGKLPLGGESEVLDRRS